MFKTGLRIIALTIIVIGSFYCGRATMFAKSESTCTENSAKLFPPSDYESKTKQRTIEFQLKNTAPIFDAAHCSFLIDTGTQQKKTGIPNSYEMRYSIEWDDENRCFIYQDKIPNEGKASAEIFKFILGGFER